ncbi:hypothetical protein BDV19DRAFT_330207 [Aspergillus venezuelensis]
MSSASNPASTKKPATPPAKSVDRGELKRQIESVLEYSNPCTFEVQPPKPEHSRQHAKPPSSWDALRTNARSPTVWATVILTLFIVGLLYFSNEGLSISKLIIGGSAAVGTVSYGLSRWSMQNRPRRSSRKKNSWF